VEVVLPGEAVRGRSAVLLVERGGEGQPGLSWTCLLNESEPYSSFERSDDNIPLECCWGIWDWPGITVGEAVCWRGSLGRSL
jgi:hypothetical protein